MTLLVRNARQLLTLRGPNAPRRGAALADLGVVNGGAVLIRDGVIIAAGASGRIEQMEETRDAVEIDAAGRAVLPGFVDSGTWYAGERAAALRAAMARHGTTTVEVRVGLDAGPRAEIRALRFLKHQPGVVSTYAGRYPELLPLIARRRLARFVFTQGVLSRYAGQLGLVLRSDSLIPSLDGARSARALIDSGAPVALATGYEPGAVRTFSMQMAISLACTRMGMTPAEAISAATINGAHALGVARCAGSLEAGKRADLILLNASDFRELPYLFGTNNVHLTIQQGEIVS